MSPGVKNIVMFPAIHKYDDQTFDDMNEESDKQKFVIEKPLRPLPSHGIVEQAKKMVN